LKKAQFDFLKPTIIFSIVGVFIPGFTAIGLLGLQMILSSGGLECTVAWKTIWTISTITGIALPIIFVKYIKRLSLDEIYNLKIKLMLFNIIEYVCIQSSIGALMSKSNTLCYVSDGQNGLELIFTAWLALPILLILSLFFNRVMIQSESASKE
jgi:hypothetical protein